MVDLRGLVGHWRRGGLLDPAPSLPATASAPPLLANCLQPLIDELPEIYRSAFILSEIDGLPQKTVADHLDISLSGAKSRVQRGKEKLRGRLLECCDIETGRSGT